MRMNSKYRRAINNTGHLIRYVDTTLEHTKEFLNAEYMAKMSQRRQTLSEVKSIFELNSEYDFKASEVVFLTRQGG